jgi:uncharacterized protein
LRNRLVVFISIIQSILFLGHWFIYLTLSTFWGGFASSTASKIILALLSISFVVASLRGWYSFHPLVRFFYTTAAFWLGLSSYLLWASLACWLAFGISALAGLGWRPSHIVDLFFGLAALTAIYGVLNAALLRVRRITVKLPNLPPQWRGRVAALASDLHLGHVRNGRFIRRIIAKLNILKPDIVFLAGDVYDGTAANFEHLAQPWIGYSAPHGVYYIQGNHEEFYSHAEYLPSLQRAGVRVLNNEKMEVEGLQLVGVHYRDAIHPDNYREILQRAQIDRDRASVLLLHAPVQLPIAEAEGISLQLSGHTHGGQFFPYNFIANKVWGKVVYGLQRLGNLQTYTSYGAGTWGPPMRVATRPEIVLIQFESA